MEYGLKIKDAAQQWVSQFNAFSTDMIEKLFGDWELVTEITAPSLHKRVIVFSIPEGSDTDEGEITKCPVDEGDDTYTVEMDDGVSVELLSNEFEILRDGDLPMWGTMWQFGDGIDDWWLEECDGIRKMSQCGFRIYEHEEYGYFFGLDAGGFDFYDAFWCPLYRARGLQWHDPETETKDYVISQWRRAQLYKGLLGYVRQTVGDDAELKKILREIGFYDEELKYENIA